MSANDPLDNILPLRVFTKKYVENLNIPDGCSILEIGPNNIESNVFKLYPQTYFSTKDIFNKCDYYSLDIDPNVKADFCGDITNLTNLTELNLHKFDVILCNSVLEHVDNIFDTSYQLASILKPFGVVYIVSPWSVRLHGPTPDNWRISDLGFEVIFGKHFNVYCEKINVDGNYDSTTMTPLAFAVELRRLY